MNSTTIIAYIAKLAKENKNLKMEIDTIKQRNVELREVIAMLRYREDCDAESVASNESGEDNEFKKKAYMRAAHVIKDFPIELMNSAQIAHINGIGKGITKLVDEYMNTGTFKKLRA
jgi:predicted RNase H-like nuclease (RuvC/YqgF family)